MKNYNWIHLVPIKDENTTQYLIDLDQGEAETLVLARELKADLVIMDEVAGRRVAKSFGLTLTGTLGVLLAAKSEGHIQSVRPLIEELLRKGTWLSPKLVSSVLKLAGQ